MAQTDGSRAPLMQLVAYYLKLGAAGFGGPIALAARMQEELVERRRWFSIQEYLDGLAFAQLCPGPLAAQLAMYLGYLRAGVGGCTLVAAAFVLPSFLMVLALSAVYVRYDGLLWMQACFYGVGAAVIAIIARAAARLARRALGRDPVSWLIFATLAITTALTSREIVWLLGVGGIATAAPALFQTRPRATAACLGAPGLWWLAVGQSPALELFLFFSKAGLVVFGSGLAIVPFLYGSVVQEHRWLTERQFLDAVAVAMITPGPVVITVAFIGYIMAGVKGACAAAVGVFLPAYLLTVVAAPSYRRYASVATIRAFVNGVTAATTGALAGAVVVLAQRAIVDVPTSAIAALAFVVTLRWKVPEPLIVVAAAAIGLAVAP